MLGKGEHMRQRVGGGGMFGCGRLARECQWRWMEEGNEAMGTGLEYLLERLRRVLPESLAGVCG